MPNKMGIKGMYLYIKKAVCERPTAIIFSGEKQNFFSQIRNKDTYSSYFLPTSYRKS